MKKCGQRAKNFTEAAVKGRKAAENARKGRVGHGDLTTTPTPVRAFPSRGRSKIARRK